MRRTLLLLFFTFLALALKAQSEGPVTTITLKAIAGLQFDKVRIQLRPGTKVRIVLKNEDDMSHNLVFTKPGARPEVVDAALKLAEKGPEMNYIPNLPEVLWSIPVLSPGEEQSLVFTAPNEPGVYPYVCTFPGHGFIMYGAMYVTTEETLPDITNDLNVPESRRKVSDDLPAVQTNDDSHTPSGHPYVPKPPFLYRAYMEDASPAAIAVSLPHKLSYCWDAGTCELRYAWKGGFVDNTNLWKGKPNAVAKILGDVFFRIHTRQPLRIADPESIPVAAYKGYRLIDRYPEFHYTLDGLDVYEIIKPKADGSGLIRTFRIPAANENIWFCANADDGVAYGSSPGKWRDNRVMISSVQARNFTIVMTKKEEVK